MSRIKPVTADEIKEIVDEADSAIYRLLEIQRRLEAKIGETAADMDDVSNLLAISGAYASIARLLIHHRALHAARDEYAMLKSA